MKLAINKVVRNMLLVGGLVSTTSFFIGFGRGMTSFRFNYPKNWKTLNIQNIKNINNIDDLEYQKGCKFLFYKRGTVVNVKDARGYLETDKESKLIEEVEKHKDKCEKDRFVYVDFQN